MKRDRRTKKQVRQLDSQIIELLRARPGISVTSIYEAMTDAALVEPVEKSDRGYRHVQSRCVLLRRDGQISQEVIYRLLDEISEGQKAVQS